jgi:hypothetical protein
LYKYSCILTDTHFVHYNTVPVRLRSTKQQSDDAWKSESSDWLTTVSSTKAKAEMGSTLILHVFYGNWDSTLALYRILPAGHQYLHDMHVFSPSRDHERSVDENCCLFCSIDTHVGSNFVFKFHGVVCDRKSTLRVQDFVFSQWCWWRFKSSGMLCHVYW